jgi:hypothetical protein
MSHYLTSIIKFRYMAQNITRAKGYVQVKNHNITIKLALFAMS